MRLEGKCDSTYHRASQTSLCLAASPPPQIKKERVAAVARERHSGNTLFSSFLGRGEGEEKNVCEAPYRITTKLMHAPEGALKSFHPSQTNRREPSKNMVEAKKIILGQI